MTKADHEVFLYSHSEEFANGLSHAAGMFLSIYAFISLLKLSTPLWGGVHYLSVSLYCLSMLGLYLASTLYHFEKNKKKKLFFKKLDHIFIYFLIAGTYTPFLNISIGGSVGSLYLWGIWGIAILGTIFKLFYTGSFNRVSLAIYLMMSWLALLLWNPLVSNLSEEGFLYILVGGALYTFGTVFFVLKKLAYHHFIWHLFVLSGSFFHYLAVKSIFI